MATWRKRPIEIEAREFTAESAHDVYLWVESTCCGSHQWHDDLLANPPTDGITIDPGDGAMIIFTLEGAMRVTPGDFVIQGVSGEFYPCKPEIFRATYEFVAQ